MPLFLVPYTTTERGDKRAHKKGESIFSLSDQCSTTIKILTPYKIGISNTDTKRS